MLYSFLKNETDICLDVWKAVFSCFYFLGESYENGNFEDWESIDTKE